MEIVKTDSPYQPIEVLLQLQELPRDHQAVEGCSLHARDSVAHSNLLLDPIPISQVQDLDHQLYIFMHLELIQLILHFSLLFVLKLILVDAVARARLAIGGIELL